ncbi:MAG TPA: hypothetical protein PKH10_01555 [bacterium]|nr:hypothetical protein [bacterium]
MPKFITAEVENACRKCRDYSFLIPHATDVTKYKGFYQHSLDIGGKIEFALPDTSDFDAKLARWDMDGENDWFRLFGMVYIHAGKITLSHLPNNAVQVDISFSLDAMKAKKKGWELHLDEIKKSKMSPANKESIVKRLETRIRDFQKLIDEKAAR